MSDIILKTTATLDSFQSRKDRSYSMRFTTQELSPAEVAAMSTMVHQYGALGFVAPEQVEELENMEAPEIIVEKGQKTPSERLRAVIFVRWMDKGSTGSFEDFYKSFIEGIITQVKNQLPPQ